jgi:hypothetical protein
VLALQVQAAQRCSKPQMAAVLQTFFRPSDRAVEQKNMNVRRIPILRLKNGIVRSRQAKSTKIPKRFGTQWAAKSGRLFSWEM